ncbi:NAD(P)H-quinone oxidoreductase subunit 3 [Candidatus Bathyarchaeota archaeon]|nr:NAD(P)H-quinone oxidoreductase subunit 3 [Candidatus Bathyarchaeota archaeon]
MVGGLTYVLPIVFGVSLAVALIIYWIGGRLAPKSIQGTDKNAPYSCGEHGPVKEAKLNSERFLTYAVYFLIFDVFAFAAMTSFYAGGFLPVIYALVVLTAVGMLIFARKNSKQRPYP